jgi:hypothetical protein
MRDGECVDCRTPPPATQTAFTLISATHGWRISRGHAADGAIVIELRCPACWQKHKARGGSIVTARRA